MKRNTTKKSGTRQNIGSKKKFAPTEGVEKIINAEKMALLAQSKIEGKKMVPHPTLKKSWIYE